MCALVACERLETYKGGREHKGGSLVSFSLSLSLSLSLGKRLYINLELEVLARSHARSEHRETGSRTQDAGHGERGGQIESAVIADYSRLD